MTAIEQRAQLQEALHAFGKLPLRDAAARLWDTLGYRSSRTLSFASKEAFREHFESERKLNLDRALWKEWRDVQFLFQLTDDEVKSGLTGQLTFDGKAKVEGAAYESFLFLTIRLVDRPYTRTQLATILREVNKLFLAPAIILFRHGDTLTVASIHRRLHKREQSRDVLGKVTLIKDIRFASPHRAHVDILSELSLGSLADRFGIRDFVALHRAWQETLNIQTLNRRFFVEIRNWFYWARLNAQFPKGAQKDADDRDSEALIRLLTRLIFCWFLREKSLITGELFSEAKIESLLRNWNAADCEKDRAGRYYKAILQNLFFATLNTPIDQRKFRSARSYHGKNKHYGDQRYFRQVALFEDKAPVEELYKTIPFLNGGLFEMLDEIPGAGDESVTKEKRVDGFSDASAKQPLVPDYLFFGDERRVPELAGFLGESSPPKARGLIKIFRDYKFTVEENTPLEQDIALDPELLGRAFENLLAAVNPETGTVARKSTGSYYTPREIVNYMVEEAVFRNLLTRLTDTTKSFSDLEERLRELVSAEKESHRFSDSEADAIVTAIGEMRILDPACGSGAFPMGLLQQLVYVLHKIDPHNRRWKTAKLAALPEEMREKAETVFREESFDYTRKLELIKDCIHGVDIQPSAIQISKLRFFLSLVIEQNDPAHIRPLPNLETKFVCANSLVGLPRPKDWELFQHQIDPNEKRLLDIRSRYFFADTKKEKDRCKSEDRKLRRELSEFIEGIGGGAAKQLASAVAAWDPYKPDRVAHYFDPESMFGVRDGFDITIGNPPYVRADEQSEWNQRQREAILASGQYETLWEKWDLFVPFIERSYKLLRAGGVSTLIVSDAFCHSKYAQKPQNWFLKHARILRLDFCADLKIFDAAVHNLVYFLQKADGRHWKPERRVHRETFGNITSLPSDEQSKLTYRVFFPEDTAAQTFSCPSVLLAQVCYISKGMVVHADEDEARGEFELRDLVSDKKDRVHSKPFVEGKHLERWLPADQKWLEWGTARAPALFSRPTFPQIYTVPEKVISVDMSAGTEKLRVAYDNAQLFHNHSAWSFVPWHALHNVRNNSLKKAARYRGEKPPRPDLPKREELEATSRRFDVKYLLGVMNSAAARDFLRANRRSNIHLYPDDWKKLPIPDVSPDQQKPIVKLVDRILVAKRADPNADLTPLEAEIDTKVAALYGVSSDSSSSPSSSSSSSSRSSSISTSSPASPAATIHRYRRTEQAMKELLRDQLLPKLAAETPYFSLETIRQALEGARCPLDPPTLNRYLHELTEGQHIFDAGRGWYSSLAKPFVLDTTSVKPLVDALAKAFPLVAFSCWSTEQVKGAMHHLLNRFVAFVNVEPDAMENVWEYLRDAGWDSWLNPRGTEATRFAVRERTVVVRRESRKSPSKEPLAPIEKLLVELYFEARDLQLMALSEFYTMLGNLAGRRRIQMATLLSYAAERKLPLKEFFGDRNQLIPPF